MIMTVKEFIDEWMSAIPYICVHTSGSTGKPKLIHLSKKLVEASARRSINHFGLDATSRLHLCLSPDYIAGKMVIVRALISGAAITAEAPVSSPLGMDTADSMPVSLLSVVGAQIPGIFDRHREHALVPIRNLLVGGAPLSQSHAKMALEVADSVWESYGMTETASHIALRRISSSEDVIYKPFVPLDGIKIGADVRGCLTVTLPGETTLVTNDMVEINDKGNFKLLGRYDNVIITGGLKVHPEQVEQKIRHIMCGIPYFISSEPDMKWGRRVVLALESSDLPEDRAKEIIAQAARLLPEHERPRKVIAVKKFKRTDTGKIIREV